MISLKVIARLLDYPEQVLFDHQQALIEALEPASELDLHHSAQLILFICRLCARPLLDVQADYCELFDRGRAASCCCLSTCTASRAIAARRWLT